MRITEKRFTVPDRYQFSHSKVQLNGESLTNAEIVRLLNVNDGAFTENFALKQENKELKQFKEKVFEIIDGHIVEERRFPREITSSEKRAIVLERRIGKVELLETLKKEVSDEF